jgi:hypothetical protein
MYDTIEVHWADEFTTRKNGISYLIRFQGLTQNPGQFEIVNSDDSNPLSGTNVTLTAETTVPYSTNLFYESIPFEWLKTYETEP